MIFDKLENLEKYKNAHPRFAAAIPYLKAMLDSGVENGKHYMPDCDVPEAVFAKVFHYETNVMGDSVKMEAHHRYIDIQIVLEGEEYMYVPSTDVLTEIKPYDETTDCEFMAMPAPQYTTCLSVPAGYFAIFFANEPHAPGVSMSETSTTVRKMVGKVLDT